MIRTADNYTEVDISLEALKYLDAIGYARAWFRLAPDHVELDECDAVASQFTPRKFLALKGIIANAPVIGDNPPAPLYGLTHPSCLCFYRVLPPYSWRQLNIPGDPDERQLTEVLRHMYPQDVYALSRVPEIQDIGFSSIVNVTPARPPVQNMELMDKPWYQKSWEWISNEIFRHSGSYLDYIKYAGSFEFNTGDVVRLYNDIEYVSELGIATPIRVKNMGYVVGNLPDYNKVLVYFSDYNNYFPVDADSIIKDNDNAEHKKVGIFNKELNDFTEGVLIRTIGDNNEVYDLIKNEIVVLPSKALRRYGG